MTQKTAPTPPKPKVEQKVTKPKELSFWEVVELIREKVAKNDFGASVGKGGSDLKNSHQLFHFIRPIMIEHNLVVDIEPKTVDATVTSNTVIVAGMYNAKFFLRGELVYETNTYGAFDNPNTAQGTHGSATAAKTALYFNLFMASVKSQEDMENDRQQELNRQQKRTPASTGGGGYTPLY